MSGEGAPLRVAHRVTILGCGGSAGSPLVGGPDGAGDWGELDPAEPRNRRSRPSIIIEAPDGRRLLVDTGPDLREQLLAARIPRIDAVLYTHAHADHIAGLDEIRILNRLLDGPMPTYATAANWDELRLRFDYAFKPWTGGGFYRPVLHRHDIAAGESHNIIGLPVTLIEQDHGFISSLALRIGNFAYCTDVVRLDKPALAALAGLDIFVIDCFTRGGPHPTHAHLELVLQWIAQLRPRRTILTHMGPTMDYRWLLANLPAGVEPAYDGMILNP